MNALITLLDETTLNPRVHLIVHRDQVAAAIVAAGDEIDEKRINRVIKIARTLEQRALGQTPQSAHAGPFDGEQAVPLVMTPNGQVPATQQAAGEALIGWVAAAAVVAVIIGGLWLQSVL